MGRTSHSLDVHNVRDNGVGQGDEEVDGCYREQQLSIPVYGKADGCVCAW